MADTTNKTAEALAALFLSAMEWGRDYWVSFSMRGASQQEVAEQFADEARALAIQPQAEPVAADREGLLGDAIRALIRGEIRCSDDLPEDRRPRHVSARRAFGAVHDLLAARPPVASPAPAARREPGWNGPMVNDAAAQAEPVAAEAIHYADLTPDEAIGWPDRGTAEDKNRYLRDVTERRKSLAARPPVAQTPTEQAKPGHSLNLADNLFIEQRGDGVWLVCVDRVHSSMKSAQAACDEWKARHQDRTLVMFHGIEPINPVKGAAQPMVPDSWRYGFRANGDGSLTFQFMDEGPFVAHAAVAQQGAAEAVAWRTKFDELLEDYAMARVETVLFNAKVIQRGRLSRPRLEALQQHVATLTPQPAAAQPVTQGLTDEQIDAMAMKMADFFMGWPLPDDFHPDGGVSFKPVRWTAGDFGVQTSWPTGTNLLSHEQACKMFRAALSAAHPAQADEGDSKASADEGGV
jgi:hypothetical protein